MSETNETPVVETAATETVAKAKKTPTKAKAKPAAKPAAPSTLTGVQHRVLKTIASAKGPLSRKKLLEKAFNGGSVNLKVIIDPLVEAKLLVPKELDVDGKKEMTFTVTAAGRKASEKPAPVRATSGVAHKNLPKIGESFEKTYKEKTYKIAVVDGGFKWANKTYTSLTALAKAVRGNDQEVNGWMFFGLTK